MRWKIFLRSRLFRMADSGQELSVPVSASLVGLALLACCVFLSAIGGWAADGKALAGFYNVRKVSQSGDAVRVTLNLRLFNRSDADVANATVTVRGALLPKAYGSFRAVSVPARKSLRLSGDFTIPVREFERWRRGARPSLLVEFGDAEGNPARQTVRLIRRPIAGKE